jgi:menaquinone-dependent protoporphyrinogen oxidase
MARILVLYGTTEGQTAKIANAVASTLEALGCDTDLVEAGTCDPAPEHYAAVIVAASVHAGSYQREVGRWVREHVGQLAMMPAAFVSVCLAAASKDPKAAAEAQAIVNRFLDEVRWRPAMTRVVAGALLYTRYNILERWFMKRIVAKQGGDTDTSRDYEYTDWNDVRAFAGDFARRVRLTWPAGNFSLTGENLASPLPVTSTIH